MGYGKGDPVKTRAAVLWGPTQHFEIEELELDEPKEGELLIKLVATGLCHSDWYFATGDSPGRYPIVAGHEGAGIVEKVGPGVTDFQPGDHVVLTFIPPCGKCRWCLSGIPVLCDRGANVTIGAQLDGTFRLHTKDGQDVGQFAMIGCFSEWTVAPTDAVVKIDPEIPLDKACLVACAVPTGAGAAMFRGGVRPGDTVAVYGVGGVGMNAVQGAVLSGAVRVIVIDRVPWKLEKAREFGATHTIDVNREDVVQRVMEITNGVGCDKVLLTLDHVKPEHVGIGAQITRKAGRLVIVGASGRGMDHIAVTPREFMLLAKEIVGTIFGHSNPKVDIPRFLELYKAGKYKLDELVTKTYKLDEINEGYRDVVEGRVIRGVLLFDH